MSIVWSVFGIYLITQVLEVTCVQYYNSIYITCIVCFVVNIVDMITILAMLHAKACDQWVKKLFILHTVIAVKLFLTLFNFIIALICCFEYPCGYTKPDPLSYATYYRGKTLAVAFRFYDVKIAGLSHLFASVGQFCSAMLLAIKRNDLKMYALWRTGQLDNFIQEIHSNK